MIEVEAAPLPPPLDMPTDPPEDNQTMQKNNDASETDEQEIEAEAIEIIEKGAAACTPRKKAKHAESTNTETSKSKPSSKNKPYYSYAVKNAAKKAMLSKGNKLEVYIEAITSNMDKNKRIKDEISKLEEDDDAADIKALKKSRIEDEVTKLQEEHPMVQLINVRRSDAQQPLDGTEAMNSNNYNNSSVPNNRSKGGRGI